MTAVQNEAKKKKKAHWDLGSWSGDGDDEVVIEPYSES